MKFVDEATVQVEAGRGGNGCASFRREKFVPRGGPDGGDGGHGGSVYLIAKSGINTLAEFRVQRRFAAESGRGGAGRQRTGASGEDLYVPVPAGTVVSDIDTEEVLGDLADPGQTLKVAQGGRGGLGNSRFKSSVNRAPRKFTTGDPGEKRRLALELKLLADIGLLGLPNAGKSTLLRALSAARPKVASYPFTTLHPHLGVVRIEADRSFVVADIPGLIEGAAQGAGLGIQFLRHLQRTRLLVHVVEFSASENGLDPTDGDPVAADSYSVVANDGLAKTDVGPTKTDDGLAKPDEGPGAAVAVRTIESELATYSDELAGRPRWLAVNKLDLLPADRWDAAVQTLVNALDWNGPAFGISAATGQGTRALARSVMEHLEAKEVQV